MSTPAPAVTGELKTLLRAVKLGRCLDTLPERLALAKQRDLSHHEFLELVLADEVTRRETSSAGLRARTAGLDPNMTLDHWDSTAKINYDHQVFDELCSLRFIDAGHNALIMGPVGVGKTFMATALGHAAVRRRYSVTFFRVDVLLKRLRASRLDNSHDAEIRKLLRVDLLILGPMPLAERWSLTRGGRHAAQEKGYPPEILVPPMTFLKFYSEVGQPIQLPLTAGDTPVLDHDKFKAPWAQLSATDGDLVVGDPVPNFLLMAERSKAEYDAMKTFDWGMEAVSPGVGEEGWYLCTCTCTDPDDPRMCPTPDLFKPDGKYPQGEGDYGAMSEALVHKCDGILGRYGGNELHWVACTLVAFSDADQMQDMPVLTTAQTGVGLDPAQLSDIKEAIGTSRERLASLGDAEVVNFAVGTDDPGKPESACVLLGDEHDPKVNDYVRGRSTIWDGQLRKSGGKFVVSGPAGKPQELLDSLAKVMGPRYANAFIYKSSIFGNRA